MQGSLITVPHFNFVLYINVCMSYESVTKPVFMMTNLNINTLKD